MEKFDILIEVQEPTAKQLGQPSFMLEYRETVKNSKNYRESLLRILEDRIDFSLFLNKEILVVKFRWTGRHKIDYSTIKNKRVRSQIRRVLEDFHPVIS